jgi:hypothetical protein
MDFVVDFNYCENGNDNCNFFVFSEITDSILVLTVESFGIPPFTYIWNDRSTESVLNIPIDADDPAN